MHYLLLLLMFLLEEIFNHYRNYSVLRLKPELDCGVSLRFYKSWKTKCFRVALVFALIV